MGESWTICRFKGGLARIGGGRGGLINNAQDVGSWHIGTQRHWYAMKLLAACAIGDLLKNVLYLSSFFFLEGGIKYMVQKYHKIPLVMSIFFPWTKQDTMNLQWVRSIVPFVPCSFLTLMAFFICVLFNGFLSL